jgi:ribosomal protein S1
VTEELQTGQAVDGVVSGVADFGIFVDLGEGVEGLVHVSEMPDREAVYAELESGDPIRVCVLEVDHWRRRIALSLQGVERLVPSSVVEDTVPLLADKG